ncbi:MAG: hypothetical protein H6907_10030 [Hyphomicrobiales bacterium]|nr:hypothetical protein [Hyphomicrobiales bacterium]MCP5372056.1 hypothetical protein [Hyphomicrobiales bacterium]
MLADYALRTLNLWYWFAAFVAFAYLPVLAKSDHEFNESHDAAAKKAQEVTPWLTEQDNHVFTQK